MPNREGPVYTIEFHLPEEAMISLSILSEHGKTIGQIIERAKFASGRHEIEFGIEHSNGNTCFYRLSMRTSRQEIVDTKKIFL